MAFYRLSARAEDDIVSLLRWSESSFGLQARQRYGALLVTAFRDIAADPNRAGSRRLHFEAQPDLRLYHLRHSRQRARGPDGLVHAPRHIIIYRQTGPERVEIVRVLHDAMDPELRLTRGPDA